MMDKFMKYALVAFLCVAMLFNFTSCDDDNDEESLSDTEVVNIIATAFVDAILTTTEGDDDISNGDGGVYAIWGTGTDENNLSDFYITITTGVTNDSNPNIESEYVGYVGVWDESVSSKSYSVLEHNYTAIHEVVIKAGSNVEVHLMKMMAGAGPVYVSIDSTLDGASKKLALTAYLDNNLNVLGSDDNSTEESTDASTEDASTDESTEEVDYTPILTINGKAADMTEDEVKALVESLITGVTSVIYS